MERNSVKANVNAKQAFPILEVSLSSSSPAWDMPVSSAGHLPHITSTTYPALVSYLTSTHHAQKVSNWSISIRILRSSFETGKDSTSRPKSMFVVSLSEFPDETFILIEDGEKDTRASVRARIQAQRQQQQEQQNLFMNDNNNVNDPTAIAAPSNNIAQLQTSLQKTSTRYTLFTTSTYYTLLLSRLNLPPALGAPSMGDGVSSTHAAAGPGAWLPRGGTIVIEGATYELPSAARYGVEEMAHGSNCEWRVRLGMLQSGASRGSGAIVEVSSDVVERQVGWQSLTRCSPLLQLTERVPPSSPPL